MSAAQSKTIEQETPQAENSIKDAIRVLKKLRIHAQLNLCQKQECCCQEILKEVISN